MKKYISKFVAVFLIAMGFSFASSAQFVIKVRPAAPVVRVRPVTPGPKHVWVTGEYAWRGGRYEYVEGYWVVPPRSRTVWVDGKWRHRRGGWVWIRGHWR